MLIYGQKHMKKLEIKNAKLIKILEERGKILDVAKGLQKQIEELQKEQAKIGYKMDRLKEKTKKIIDKTGFEMDKHELISRVYSEDGKAYAEIINQIEEYKKVLNEKNKKN